MKSNSPRKPLVGAALDQPNPVGGASDGHRHTYESLLGKPVFLAPFVVDTFANLPAGSAALDGRIAYDTTNNRIVFYEAGVRRASAGAMAIV